MASRQEKDNQGSTEPTPNPPTLPNPSSSSSQSSSSTPKGNQLPPVIGGREEDALDVNDVPADQRPPRTDEEFASQGTGHEKVLALINEAAQDDDATVGGDEGGKDGVPGVRLNGPAPEEARRFPVTTVRPAIFDPFPYSDGESRHAEDPLNARGFIGTDPIYQDPNSEVRTPGPLVANSSTMDLREDVGGLVVTPSVENEQDEPLNAGEDNSDK